MTIWFTSDTHFSHANIIRYCHRPYQSVQEMDEALIAGWNARVGTRDEIYHLGDVLFCDEERGGKILRRLNGRKHLVWGNHDQLIRGSAALQSFFVWCQDLHEMAVQGQRIVLCHYPLLSWPRGHHGAWMLHGHCHGCLQYPMQGRIHDVGVDPNHYAPVSVRELQGVMKQKDAAGD